jgi:uncharacterized sporulation protein YeaH/YhbH (DUF444 family)
MPNTNGKLTNSQRQSLVKLVENAYSRRIEDQRKQLEDALAQVTREVKAELGVARVEDELLELESRMRELEAQKEKLGFSRYNHNPIPGSEARRMIDQGASAEKEKITALHTERMFSTRDPMSLNTEMGAAVIAVIENKLNGDKGEVV